MAKGLKTGGRKKGTPNKVTTTVRDNVLEVFRRIGGVNHMAAWALDNPTDFYRLYCKMLPSEKPEENEDDHVATPVKIEVNVVDASKPDSQRPSSSVH